MANTYQLIEAITLGASGASTVTFSSIPGTYTDLKLVYSARATNTNIISVDYILVNGSSSGISNRFLYAYGTSPGSSIQANGIGVINESGATANTFSNNEIYIPNYASSNAKSMSSDNSNENNGTDGGNYMFAVLSTSTSAITSITIQPEIAGIDPNTIVEYSTFYLYGINNS
jgi:hypothetical protein